MTNCDYKLISSNEIGNIMYSDPDKELIIGIGTLILKFKQVQASVFLKALKDTFTEFQTNSNKLINKVFLKTPVNNLMIALNKNELEKGIELLEFGFLRIGLLEVLPID